MRADDMKRGQIESACHRNGEMVSLVFFHSPHRQNIPPIPPPTSAGLKPRAFRMLDKCSCTELYPNTLGFVVVVVFRYSLTVLLSTRFFVVVIVCFLLLLLLLFLRQGFTM